MEERKAAAYIRVSTEEQAEYSPKSQLDKIYEYAKRNGFFVPDEFVFKDEGISGRSTNKRDAFNRMILAAKSKPTPFDTILVWKFSRFARNREDSIVYKSMLRRELGIRVISVSEDVGDDKMSVLFESMIEAMDEYYSVNLAEEVRRGMIERVKSGGVCAAAPFGYEIKDKFLFKKEDEAEIIRRVFAEFSRGESMVEIARRLNDMGVHTHRGNKIESRTVEYWLNNPVYIGKVRWNPQGKTQRYHWEDSGIIISDGQHEKIVEKELWDRVQMLLFLKKKGRRKQYECKNKSSWLAGLVKCGICKGAMVNCGGYFYCLNKRKGTCTGNGGVNVKKLEGEVSNLICEMECVPLVDILGEDESEMKDRLILKEKKKLLRIEEAFEEGIDTLLEYKRKKKSVLERIEALEKEKVQKTEIMRACCISDIIRFDGISNERKFSAVRHLVSHIEKTGKEEYNIFLNLRCMVDQTEN